MDSRRDRRSKMWIEAEISVSPPPSDNNLVAMTDANWWTYIPIHTFSTILEHLITTHARVAVTVAPPPHQ